MAIDGRGYYLDLLSIRSSLYSQNDEMQHLHIHLAHTLIQTGHKEVLDSNQGPSYCNTDWKTGKIPSTNMYNTFTQCAMKVSQWLQIKD